MNGKTEKDINDGFEAFKTAKYAKELGVVEDIHLFSSDSITEFVELIMDRTIFDGERLNDYINELLLM